MEIKKISEEQAREMFYISKSCNVNEVVKIWKIAGYIEQSALEKAEDYAKYLLDKEDIDYYVDIENMINYYRQAIKELQDINESLITESNNLKYPTDHKGE